MKKKQKQMRGFAVMSPEKQKKIASKGGSMSGGNFKHDVEKARRAGRIGGLARHAKKV